MSEQVHLSNKSSGLYQASRAAGGALLSQYSYSMPKPSCNKFIDKWQKSTFTGCDFGKEVTASIPPYGLVKSMLLKFSIKFKPGADGDAGGENKTIFARAMGAQILRRAVHSRTRARSRPSTQRPFSGRSTNAVARTPNASA